MHLRPTERSLYTKLLAQDLANRMFKRFAMRAEANETQSAIELLVFSLPAQPEDCLLCYTKGLATTCSALGLMDQFSVTAVPIGSHLINYIKSESIILDYSH